MKDNYATRVMICNEILEEISKHDHKFFVKDGVHAKFFVSDGKLGYYDEKLNKAISMHPKIPEENLCSHGGNLWGLIRVMAKFINTGETQCLFSRYWGYRYESLCKIHDKAYELCFTDTLDFHYHDYRLGADVARQGGIKVILA